MKDMELIDKIKKGAMALGLAGTIAFSGCAGLQPGPFYPRFLTNQSLVDIPDNQNRAEQEYRQENTNTRQTESLKKHFYVCNEVRDLDNNGRIDYPYDLKGRKEGDIIEVNYDENICFVGVDIAPKHTHVIPVGSGGKLFDIKFIMLNERDDLLYQKDVPIYEMCGIKMDYGKMPQGNYKVYFINTETNEKEEMKLKVSGENIVSSDKE